MKLILVVLALAVLAGLLAGGHLAALSRVRLRWAPLAIVGFALQLLTPAGDALPLVLLLVSFALLIAFSLANLGIFGFPLILVGIVLNLTVISVNQGMPVSRHALVASGQADQLRSLIRDGGAKHHLATDDDRLLFLGDVIPVGAPVSQVVSLGDLFTYGGVVLVLVAGMLGRARSPDLSPGPPGSAEPAAAAGGIGRGGG